MMKSSENRFVGTFTVADLFNGLGEMVSVDLPPDPYICSWYQDPIEHDLILRFSNPENA